MNSGERERRITELAIEVMRERCQWGGTITRDDWREAERRYEAERAGKKSRIVG